MMTLKTLVNTNKMKGYSKSSIIYIIPLNYYFTILSNYTIYIALNRYFFLFLYE